MTATPSWLNPSEPAPAQPAWLKTPEPEKPPQWLKTPEPAQPQQQQNQDPAGFRKWLTQGSIYGQNPSVNVMQDFATPWKAFGQGGVRTEFKAIVQNLVGQGNKLGVYDFNKGHHYAPNDPHLDGRAMDVDTVNGEPVATRLSPNLGQFITQALQSDPRVRLGVPQEIYNQLVGKVGNQRIFVDAPAHIHVELDPGGTLLGKVPGTVKPTDSGISPSQIKALHPVAQQPQQQGFHIQPPTEAGIAQAIHNAATTVEETGKGFFKEWHYEQGHPLEAYSDVEGVFQRAISGYLSQADPTGKNWVTPPNKVIPAVGQAIFDAFHPHSPEVYNRDTSAAIRSLFTPLGVTEANQGTWAHFGQMVVASSATDPFSYAPYVGQVMHAAGIAGALSKMGAAVREMPEVAALISGKQQLIGKLANNAVSQLVKEGFGIRPELDKYLEPHAKDARIMIEHAASAETEPLRVGDEELLAQNEQELRNLKPDANGEYHVPEPIRQRYLREPYVFGTPEMREQAVALGYKPTPGEEAATPMGLLHYDLQKDYQTLIKPPGESLDDAVSRVSGGTYKKANAGFEQNRKGESALGEDQFDITANRLRLGRGLVRARLIDKRTQEYLDAHGGWANTAPAQDVTALSNNPWQIKTKAGQFFKKLGTESIKAFPFPHAIGNVGQLAWNKGGWTAAGLGLKHAVTGLNDAQIERMKSLGLWAEYLGRDLNSPWRKPPLSYLGGRDVDKAIEYSTQILNRLEGGFRQALLDLADHQHGFDPHNMQNEYKKAKDVLDAIGDYRNLSKVVAVLDGVLGAPFVAFGTSIVPKAITKALKEYPGRVAGAARAQEGLQHDKGGPLPPGVKLGGGPVESFGRMATDPVGYAESPSRLGPLGNVLQVEERIRHSEPVDPAQLGGQAAQEYGGSVGNVLTQLFGLAYPAPGAKRGDLDLRAAMLDWMTGRYIGTERSPKSDAYYNRLEEAGTYPKHHRRQHFSR